MATSVTINGSDYSIPAQGQSPPWGSDLSDLLQAIVAVLNTLQNGTDISTTSLTIANHQAVSANVTGLSFDTSQVRSAIISYSIYRSSSINELSEAGQIYLTYKSTDGTWELAQYYAGNSGVAFTITNAGQVKYTSTDIGAVNYIGKLKFNASTFIQT